MLVLELSDLFGHKSLHVMHYFWDLGIWCRTSLGSTHFMLFKTKFLYRTAQQKKGQSSTSSMVKLINISNINTIAIMMFDLDTNITGKFKRQYNYSSWINVFFIELEHNLFIHNTVNMKKYSVSKWCCTSNCKCFRISITNSTLISNGVTTAVNSNKKMRRE